MENKEYGSIVGNSSAPYLNSLISQYGLATNYDAVSHPSEPNYLALFSGSTQGITDDADYYFSGTTRRARFCPAARRWPGRFADMWVMVKPGILITAVRRLMVE